MLKKNDESVFFSRDDFLKYSNHADDISTLLNQLLKEHGDKDNVTSESIATLRKDMLNNPDLYLPANLSSKLYFEQ